ncbi:MAG TPA: O-antigen ligase family protein [Mucilaginibacter sp.]|nr:O-antigen ligase family protein [Mucilaginibacter sp.]
MLGAIERPRISSFAWHAIYYGFLLNTGILLCAFFINVYSGGYGQKTKYVYLLILLLVNLVLVNSRTPLLALAFGFLVLFLWEFNLANKLRVGVLVIVLFSSLVFIPKGRQIVSAAFSALTSTEQSYEEGSSLDMRIGQLQASYDLFKKKPVTGNGLYYIKETLGFSRDWNQSKSDKDLYGFESYVYELLIEQGLLGIIGNIFLFASLFIFFIKNNISKNRGTKKLSLLGIALLVAYLSFIIGTGDMGSFPVFMIVMGITIKGIVLLNPFETILSRLNYSADLLTEV